MAVVRRFLTFIWIGWFAENEEKERQLTLLVSLCLAPTRIALYNAVPMSTQNTEQLRARNQRLNRRYEQYFAGQPRHLVIRPCLTWREAVDSGKPEGMSRCSWLGWFGRIA